MASRASAALPSEAVPSVTHQPPFDIPWFRLPAQLPQERLRYHKHLLGEAWPRRAGRRAYYRFFGRWPCLTILNPFWASAQPLLAAIEAARAAGARDAIVVADSRAMLSPLNGLKGKIAYVQSAGLETSLLCKALEPHNQFDLCILQLNPDDIPRLSELLVSLAPYMRHGGTVIGSCRHRGVSLRSLAFEGGKSAVALTGSAMSVRAISLYSAAFNRLRGRRFLDRARGLMMLVASLPLAVLANAAEAAAARKGRMVGRAFRTSVTLIVQQE
jgi:hypothetical protein